MGQSRNIQESLQIAQTSAIRTLLAGTELGPDGKTAIPPVSLASITGPSVIQQELPFVSTRSTYDFNFAANGPIATAALNNLRINQNDIMASYAIQVRLGQGATQIDRVYRSRGLTPADNSLYTGFVSFTYEALSPQYDLPMSLFLDEETLSDPYFGFEFIAPQRIYTGYLSVFKMTITLDDISGLTLTPNMFISVTLHGMTSRSSN